MRDSSMRIVASASFMFVAVCALMTTAEGQVGKCAGGCTGYTKTLTCATTKNICCKCPSLLTATQKTACNAATVKCNADYSPEDAVVEMLGAVPSAAPTPNQYSYAGDGDVSSGGGFTAQEFAFQQRDARARLAFILQRLGHAVDKEGDASSVLIRGFTTSPYMFSLKNISDSALAVLRSQVYSSNFRAVSKTITLPRVSVPERGVAMASESEISLIHKFQLGLKNPGGAYIVDRDGQMYVGKKDADIAVADAWRLDSSLGISLGRRNVVVAVIDDGFDLTSPEVSRNLYTNMGEGAANRCNNKDDDGNGFIDDYQGWDAVAEHGCYDSGALIENIDVPGAKGHGSHVASIIAGGRDKTNPTSAAGVAPFVSILPIKAFSPESGGYQTANLIKAYNYVLALKKRGVNIAVVNTSYAGPCSDLGDGEVQALVALVQAGITVVGAAGNVSGSLPTDNDSIPHCPGNLGATRGAELGVQGIVSVAMSAPGPRSGNNLITLHPWSRQGARTVNVAAPGTSIYANGEFRSGTSMATPHVSGIVALMYSVNPFITPAEVERILSDPSNSMNYGFPVVSKGIVSAQKAVQAAAAKIVSGVVSFNGRPYRAAEVIMVQGRDVLRSRTDSSGYFFFPLSSTALPVTIDVKAEGLYAPSQTKVGSPAPRFSFGLEQVLKPGPGKSMVK